jgi:hypothetical protein
MYVLYIELSTYIVQILIPSYNTQTHGKEVYIHLYTELKEHKATGTQRYRHIELQAHGDTGTHSYRHTETQAHRENRHMETQAHTATGTQRKQAHGDTGTQRYWHKELQAQRAIFVYRFLWITDLVPSVFY